MISSVPPPNYSGREEPSSVRALANQAFSRAAGAALIPGNGIRLLKDAGEVAARGDAALRVVAGTPATGGMFRVDQLIAALARKHLWLTDAYCAGMTSCVQALRSAAKDGVDVRLLVPSAADSLRKRNDYLSPNHPPPRRPLVRSRSILPALPIRIYLSALPGPFLKQGAACEPIADQHGPGPVRHKLRDAHHDRQGSDIVALRWLIPNRWWMSRCCLSLPPAHFRFVNTCFCR